MTPDTSYTGCGDCGKMSVQSAAFSFTICAGKTSGSPRRIECADARGVAPLAASVEQATVVSAGCAPVSIT
eukprot:1423785-Prymnesium_polylepis.3